MDRTKIMGVINVTPDSFYVASRCQTMDQVLKQAEEMVKSGVEILDVGGESTSAMVRDYSSGITLGGEHHHDKGKQKVLSPDYIIEKMSQEQLDSELELERVLPVVEKLLSNFDCLISVDTSSALVMREVCQVGVGMINDIRGLTRPGAIEAMVEVETPVVLAHSIQDYPDYKFVPEYEDVVSSVISYLNDLVLKVERLGINKKRIIIDPGFGGGIFGKTPEHNLIMLSRLEEFHDLGLPILVGLSRKSFIGAVLKRQVQDRLSGSLAAAMLAMQAGAHIIRVHDVSETKDIISFLEAVEASSSK